MSASMSAPVAKCVLSSECCTAFTAVCTQQPSTSIQSWKHVCSCRKHACCVHSVEQHSQPDLAHSPRQQPLLQACLLLSQSCELCRTLNRIQSRIYPTALNSNQNLLVCAPTGAGKTNIAMLAVLHELGQNMRHGIIQKQDFKVVYVAPMKALAAEVTAAFSRRLGPLGVYPQPY